MDSFKKINYQILQPSFLALMMQQHIKLLFSLEVA